MRVVLLSLVMMAGVAGAENLESRLPFETLVDRSVGLVRRPALVEWRKSSLILDFELGQAIEYNDFNSRALSLNLRFPDESWVYKIGVSSVAVTDTDSSRLLAKTPFEQEGRPSRFEWHNGIEFPLVEGIGQQLYPWIPAQEFVLSAVALLNVYLYPQLCEQPMQILKNTVALKMAEKDRLKLENEAPSAMRVHDSLHSLSLGLSWDNYYKSGVHWNMRVLYELPAGGGGSQLRGWYSFAFGAGYAL